MTRPDYQQRVFDEYHALAVKVDALRNFLESSNSDNVTGESRHLLEQQLHWMRGYKFTLERRLHLFDQK